MRRSPDGTSIRRGPALSAAGTHARTTEVRSLASSPAPSSALGLTRPRERPLVIGCGALAKELAALTRRAGFPEVDLTCLPATLHNRPERIPEAVRARIKRARAAGRQRLFVAYADCGTGGMLDRVLEEEGVARLEGAHCYEVYAGRAAFMALAEEEPGTFYLTDFLARNFERLVIRGLGLDRHPELLPLYFGSYTRLLYLAQTDDAALTAAARSGAERLGLRFERRYTGYGELVPAMTALTSSEAGAFAPGASNSASTADPGARSVISLPRMHEIDDIEVDGVPMLQVAQRNRPGGVAARSCLHPVQRVDESLHPVQGIGWTPPAIAIGGPR